VGSTLGPKLGSSLGYKIGIVDGISEGSRLGRIDGTTLGSVLGLSLGETDGIIDGISEGEMLGPRHILLFSKLFFLDKCCFRFFNSAPSYFAVLGNVPHHLSIAVGNPIYHFTFQYLVPGYLLIINPRLYGEYTSPFIIRFLFHVSTHLS